MSTTALALVSPVTETTFVEPEIGSFTDIRAVVDLLFLQYGRRKTMQAQRFTFKRLQNLIEREYEKDLTEWSVDFRTTFKGTVAQERTAVLFEIVQYLIHRGWVLQDPCGELSITNGRYIVPGELWMDEALIDWARAWCVG